MLLAAVRTSNVSKKIAAVVEGFIRIYQGAGVTRCGVADILGGLCLWVSHKGAAGLENETLDV